MRCQKPSVSRVCGATVGPASPLRHHRLELVEGLVSPLPLPGSLGRMRMLQLHHRRLHRPRWSRLCCPRGPGGSPGQAAVQHCASCGELCGMQHDHQPGWNIDPWHGIRIRTLTHLFARFSSNPNSMSCCRSLILVYRYVVGADLKRGRTSSHARGSPSYRLATPTHI